MACRKVQDPWFRCRWWWDARLPAWHAAGLSDCQIARKVGCTQQCVWKHRRRLGLPPNAEQNRSRAKEYGRQQTSRWYAKRGHMTPTDCRWQPERIAVATQRWYQVTSSRDADILDRLEQGPATSYEVMVHLGVNSRNGEFMKRLRRLLGEGLILRRKIGRHHYFYSLAPTTRRKPPTLAEKMLEAKSGGAKYRSEP